MLPCVRIILEETPGLSVKIYLPFEVLDGDMTLKTCTDIFLIF